MSLGTNGCSLNLGCSRPGGTANFLQSADLVGGTLGRGNWQVYSGGTLNLNSGASITTLGAGASVTLGGGTFAQVNSLTTNNGSLTVGSGSYGLSSGFANNGSISVLSGATISSAGSATLNGRVTSDGTISNSGTLGVGGNLTNGSYNSGASFQNSGNVTLTGSISGQGNYKQTADSTTVTGSLSATDKTFNGTLVPWVDIQGGTLGGSGRISGNVNIGSLGELDAGHLTINGNLTDSGALKVSVLGQGPNLYDLLAVTGSANLSQSHLIFDFTHDAGAAAGSAYTFFVATSGVDSALAQYLSGNVQLLGLSNMAAVISLDSAGNGLTLTLEALPPSAVPLPAGSWLLFSGAGGLLAFARRRRPSSAAAGSALARAA